jgi:hypothetical protein
MLESFRRIFENLAKLDKPTWPSWRAQRWAAAASWRWAATWCWRARASSFGHPEIKAGVFNPWRRVLLPTTRRRKRAYDMILGGAGSRPPRPSGSASFAGIPDDKLEAEAAAWSTLPGRQCACAPGHARARRPALSALPFAGRLRHTETST